MKRIILSLALVAITALSACALRAQTATNAAVAATNAPVAAWTTNAPTSEQRLESVEAYFANTDPTATYKDTNGNWAVNFALGPSIINTNLINSQGNY